MADPWGVEPGYTDVQGNWHDTPDETRRALRVAMGGLADVDDPPPHSRPVWIVRMGSGPPIERAALLALEDGSEVQVAEAVPPDLPLGYHDLHPSDGGPVTRLIVVPDRCASPPDRAFGLAVQLYATRSSNSWGMGDLVDLRELCAWAGGQGAGFIATSPLHAPLPTEHQEPSPYFASSRLWRNPLHLRVDHIPGWDGTDAEQVVLRGDALALLDDRLIDRDRVWALQRAALERVWERHGRSEGVPATFPDFASWRRSAGSDLERYATFCALAEHHGCGWRAWPAEHRRPDGPSVARFAAERADRVSFHAWIQWLLDGQHAEAGNSGAGLVHDLAIGADPDGADAWLWQDVLATGITVGAPPDIFNESGQDWGLPPFVPWRLRAAGYAPLATLVRAVTRHGAGLRVDHVMGLFRLFWIPEGASPAQGGYVRYPETELLDILALESVRSGAYVIGEDLGTVEDGVRAQLAERGVLSYRLVWFEDGPPATYPVEALAAVTTHDLPTLAGVWCGGDDPNGELRPRLVQAAGVGDDATLAEVAEAAHRALAGAPSRVVSATLEDALGVAERPNQPGTTTERPNWSLALPVPVDDLPAHPGMRSVVAALRDGRAQITSHDG